MVGRRSRTVPADAPRTWAVCSAVLDYPTEELMASLDDLEALVPGNAELLGLVAHMAQRAGPPHVAADVEVQGDDHHRPHHDRVQQDAEGHGEAEFGELRERQGAQHREGAGQDHARGGDDAAGDREAGDRRAVGAVPRGLLPDAGHQEDVVVDAERDQEHDHAHGKT